MSTEAVQINPEQIAYLSYQIRQLEIERNDTKKPHIKESLTMRIRVLKNELDPILEAYAAQQIAKRKEQPNMVVDKELDNKDLGPTDVVAALHKYAEMKITQEECVTYLSTGKPISIAGEYDKVAYVIHFQRTESL